MLQCYLLLPQLHAFSTPKPSWHHVLELRACTQHPQQILHPLHSQGDDFGLTSHPCLCHFAGRLHHSPPAQSPQGQGEHPQVWAGAPVSVPRPNLCVQSPANFHSFRPIYGKDKRSLSLLEVPELCDLPCWVMLSLLSFEEFLTAWLSFSFCRGTKQRRSNLRHTHSQKSICQQTWVWSWLHPWYRKSKAAAET